MTRDSVLIPQDIKAQCDSAIQILEQDNTDMETVKNYLKSFMEDEELVSDAFNALKIQILDYLYIISAMTVANDLDIEDLQKLKEAVGDEELHGDIILNHIDEAYTDMEDFQDQYEIYQKKVTIEDCWRPPGSWYMEVAAYYKVRADMAEKRYGKWKDKELKYDEIDEATRQLFTESVSLRAAAKRGIESITGAFQNGSYVIDEQAAWRNEIAVENTRIIQEYKNRFLTTDADGKLQYDWKAIENWLKQDPEDVREVEYMAFIYLMEEMSEEDMDKLFAAAQIRNRMDPAFSEVSEVMKIASGKWLELSEVTAEITIFDKNSDYIYNEADITNRLSKALLVYQTIGQIDTESTYEVTVSVTEVQNGKNTYQATIKYVPSTTNFGDTELFGRIAVSEKTDTTITVYPWGSPISTEENLDENAKVSICRLFNPDEDVLKKTVSDVATNYVVGKLEDVAYDAVCKPLLSEAEVVNDAMRKLYENQKKMEAVEGGVNSIDVGQAVQALGINSGVVTITGPGVNRVELYNPRYDEEELLVRVTVYNQHQYQSITPEELEARYESDSSEITGYMDWYFGDGNVEVEEYWNALEIIAKEYPDSVREMNTQQLQELINKYNDPTYEINSEIMGETK